VEIRGARLRKDGAMIMTHQILNESEIALLATLQGHRWVDMSGDGMFDEDFAWVGVRVETTGPALNIAFEMEVIDIDGYADDYPVLHVMPSPEKSLAAINDGNIYKGENGETVSEIWVLREKLDCVSNGMPEFSNTADLTVAIKLESMWIAFVRADHFTDAFDIRRASSRDNIELPDTISEWPEDLMTQFELSREWIQVA
jgi:hypothetical protein